MRLAALVVDDGRLDVRPPTVDDRRSELADLQRALRSDLGEPVATDRRGDGTVVWHRCHGLAREVEVLRDALLHLFDDAAAQGAPIDPGEVAVLCGDVVEAAPLVEAVFAGGESVPAIPVRVADRALRGTAPLVEAAGALLDLLDGRFRAGEVLAFAQRPPVRTRFGLDADALTVLADWVDRTEVRRGLDVESMVAFGVPGAVTTNTWRAGLDQLAVGIAAGDRSPSPYGPGGVALLPGLDDDATGLFGAAAELLRRLDAAVGSLRGEHTMAEWCGRLRSALGGLCAVPDVDAAQWRTIETTLDAIVAETEVVDAAHPASHAELAALVRARLRAPTGRPRFGTGAVTVSSLTALRGVPFRVVCLLSLDGDLTSSPAVSLDDLTALAPCLGDADPRAEVRAQLLDAVLSAGERLLLVSSGFDVRTNGAVPPSTVVSELLEALGWDTDPPTDAVVAHPRHAWSDASFRSGRAGGPSRSESPGRGPWSFDRGALRGALARRAAVGGPTATLLLDRRERPTVEVDDLLEALEQPCRAFLRGRLGITLPAAPEPVDDLVPLGLSPLGRHARVSELLELRRTRPEGLTDDVVEAWADIHRHRGTLPPLRPGDIAVTEVRRLADDIVARYEAAAGRPLGAAEALEIDVAVAGRRVVGRIDGIDGIDRTGPLIVTDVGASRLGAKHQLRAWVRLALVALMLPDRRHDVVAVTAGRASSGGKADAIAITLGGATDPAEIVRCALDVLDAADRARVPLFGTTSLRLHRDGRERAAEAWEGMFGDLDDRWSAFAYDGAGFDTLLAEAPTELESIAAFGAAPSRVERWAHRVWSCFDRTVVEWSGAAE